MTYKEINVEVEKVKFEPNMPQELILLEDKYKTLSGEYGEYYAIEVRSKGTGKEKLLTTSSRYLRKFLDNVLLERGTLQEADVRITYISDGQVKRYRVELGN